MAGLDNILKEIKSDSENQAKKILDDAVAQESRILSEATEKGEKIASDIIKEAEKKAEIIVSRGEAAAELSSKRAVLKKKQELIREYINAAKERLESLEGEEYFKALKCIIEKNASAAGGEVVLSKADKAAVSSGFEAFLKEKGLKLSENELSGGSKGCIIDYGSIEENCTFETIFAVMAEELSDKTMKLLFE